MSELAIQGRVVRAEAGESLLDVALREGFEIPSLCHERPLEPYGACRVCLVEVGRPGRGRRLAAACTHPALDGIEVLLDTDRVARVRAMTLELLLAHAPTAPRVRRLAQRYGVTGSRFAPVDEPRDCILCGLCERVCREVVGRCAITMLGRGRTRTVGDPFGMAELCIGCGACDELCPTGALRQRRAALERLRASRGEDRECRYSLMGLRPAALCANDYRCEWCETEHDMLDRAGGRHPLLRGRLVGQRER